MRTKSAWNDWLEFFIISISLVCIEGWVNIGPALIAYADYTGAAKGSTSFSAYLTSGDYVGYYIGGFIGFHILALIGYCEIKSAERREKVRQHWLRRYAHRPVRSRPLA